MAENPLLIKCKSCGSKTEYDIKEQSYCCTSCARKISLVDAITNLDSWRKSQQSDIKEKLHELPHTYTHCPNCGAEFFFKENEATGICPYCDTPMIRKDYDESDSFPESIIPFKITLEEAKEKLLDLVDKPASSYSEEAEIAKKNINKMQGFYLPYSLIMGPINYNINREGTKRQFHCEIEVEKNFINGSKELDNLVLDAMEPYDWEEIVPFSFGYISGQLVKIRNIDENELTKRAVEEVANQSKKQITEELDSEVIEIKSDSTNLLIAPVLLPVYYFKVGDFTVAVNGQTGRVSMTNNHETKKIVNYSGWIALPILIAVEIISFDSIDTFEKFNIWHKILLYLYFFFVSPLGLIFILLPKKIKTIIEKLPIASDKCIAIRQEDKRIKYKFGEDVIQEKPNKLNFWELVDSKKEKIIIEVFKSSTLIKLALFAIFYPICVGFVALALVSLYHKSLPLFSNELIDILKINGGWLIGVGSCYFFGGTIYNRIKYDFKLEKYGSREFKLDKMIYSLGFIFGVVFSLIFGLAQIISTIKLGNEFVTKQAKEVTRQADLEEIHKSVPPLKQHGTIIKNVINKDKIVLNFNQNQSSYFIYFFEKDKITYWLFSVTVNKDERQYNYGKPSNKEAVSKQLYKVNTYPDSFVVTDVKTNDRWKVKYGKDQILIKKVLPNNSREDNSQVLGHTSVPTNDVSSPLSQGIASNAAPSVELLLDNSPAIRGGASELKEEKTLYSLKLSSDGNSYYLIDSSGKYIGNSYIDRKSNKLFVLRQNATGEKKTRLDYAISNHKARTDGNMLLASPALLEIEEFDINLRYIMMLELSQLE